MLYTVIKPNSYQDSINLMLLTNEVSTIEGVIQGQVMMGTDANKDIFKTANLYTDEVETATPNDMVIVVETDDESVVEKVLERAEKFLTDLSVKKDASGTKNVKNWDDAIEVLPDANLALFSIPGIYAATEIEKALDRGLHVFSFSDNVSLEDEIRLKKKAHDKGLLLMGPDCGTGIISSIPMAFTNVVNPGNIGIVGASGTGIQEVTTIIERLGGGVVHAIGTGGRDLHEDVGGITMKDAIVGLEHHDPTEVIVVISKPPAKKVRDEVMELLQSVSKPVVAIFLGEKPENHEGNVYLAHTLEETAQIAVDLANGDEVKKQYLEPLANQVTNTLPEGATVKGLYSGGTLANEAAMLISETLGVKSDKAEGYILNANGFEVMDLGDDMYTQGKPHPMIDPEVRVKKIKEAVADETTGVILLDVVLGYGAHPDMANALKPAIEEAFATAKSANREFHIIATVVGTKYDPQDYDKSVQVLKDLGVLVEDSNARAIRLALQFMGHEFKENDKEVKAASSKLAELPALLGPVDQLLNAQPAVVNVGLESFTEPVNTYGGKSVQYDWKPVAGGNQKLIRILNELEKHAEEIDAANQKVIGRLRDSQPFLVDVVPAGSVIPELNGKVLLHAGPPIKYENMTGPMQGSCVGAMLFEGWATDEADAKRQLEGGEITFIPCHHVNAVGPMGGITSANMPVLVVENKADGTTAYCQMNEGIGKVLRFGAFSEEVVNRLTWMKDTLGPVLGKALRKMDGGLNVNVIVAKAITMGDEFHQRNIAASLIFLKDMTPTIINLADVSEQEKTEVIEFLAKTDQFFLNVMMATGKSMVDYARKIKEGTVVTTMTRNGENFGVRIAALGDQWFTAPVNTPRGLYFTGYSEEDGNKDIGDSAITETIGVGGFAMIAAPGVTRFVGAGGFQDALDVSNEMQEISISNNPNWTIPTWDFKGSTLGIDVRKVVETGITPLINTGIAHKVAGMGQVGAGTVRAPLACFEKALVAYAESLGIKVD